jgi:hypothetical protein
MSNSQPEIPATLQSWRRLAAALPRLQVGHLDWSLTVATIIVLSCFRLVTEAVQVRVFGWPADHFSTKYAAACTMGIFHSTNLLPGLFYALRSQPYSPSGSFDKAPTWWQESVHALLQFCTGYMIYDGIYNIILLKWTDGMDATDYMFLGHHMATAFYMTSTRIVNAAHMSALMCMFVGEFTNPFHNSFYIGTEAMKHDCCNGPWMETFLYVDTFIFCALYVLVRAVFTPFVMTHMTYDLWVNGRKNIPIWLLAMFTLLIWGVAIGSKPWIEDCWTTLLGYIPQSNETKSTDEL